MLKAQIEWRIYTGFLSLLFLHFLMLQPPGTSAAGAVMAAAWEAMAGSLQELKFTRGFFPLWWILRSKSLSQIPLLFLVSLSVLLPLGSWCGTLVAVGGFWPEEIKGEPGPYIKGNSSSNACTFISILRGPKKVAQQFSCAKRKITDELFYFFSFSTFSYFLPSPFLLLCFSPSAFFSHPYSFTWPVTPTRLLSICTRGTYSAERSLGLFFFPPVLGINGNWL